MCCREHFILHTNKLKYFILLLEFVTFMNKIARDFFNGIYTYDFTFFLYPQSRRFIIAVLISLVIIV